MKIFSFFYLENCSSSLLQIFVSHFSKELEGEYSMIFRPWFIGYYCESVILLFQWKVNNDSFWIPFQV